MKLKLRPAVMADGDDLLRWKNDPITRQFSIITPNEIKREDHLLWLVQHLSCIQIITDGEVCYGDIRIEGDEVAIKIDAKYRGQGIAYKMLRQVIRQGMFAKIVEGNIASMRLFIKLGFVPTAYKEGYYIFQK